MGRFLIWMGGLLGGFSVGFFECSSQLGGGSVGRTFGSVCERRGRLVGVLPGVSYTVLGGRLWWRYGHGRLMGVAKE